VSAAEAIRIAQQTLKRLLIRIVVVPAREVSHMTLATNVGDPRLAGLHHRLVQANGKKYGLALGLRSLRKAGKRKLSDSV